MRAIIERVFSRKVASSHSSQLSLSSELTSSDIESYYLRIILECLGRLLVPSDAVEVIVRRTGRVAGGAASFAGYVRVLRWDPVLMPVLLQNLPVIDARVRKVVAASVILEHTHFGGIWFQVTSAVPGAPQSLVGLPAELVRHPG